jgi:hypothetical protein
MAPQFSIGHNVCLLDVLAKRGMEGEPRLPIDPTRTACSGKGFAEFELAGVEP